MKKLFIVGLILAIAGGVFAQDFKLSGNLNAGLNFSGNNERASNKSGVIGAEDEKVQKRLMVTPKNDDAGKAIRLNLIGEYAAPNYGLKFRLRFDESTLDAAGTGASNFGILNYGYVWASLLNSKLKITGGIINGSPWSTAADQEFNYAEGTGVRFEVTPIEGLNAGFLFNFPANPYNGYTANLDLIQMLTETSFGVKYSNSSMDIAAGLQLDSNADAGGDGTGRAVDGDLPDYYKKFVTDYYKATIPTGSFDIDPTTGAHTIPATTTTQRYTTGKELRAYVGVNLKMVEKLSAAIEAEFYNLGAFGGDPNDPSIEFADPLDPNWAARVIKPKGLGAIWVDEKVSYAVSDALKVGITIHEILFGGKPATAGLSDDQAKAEKAVFKPEFRFQPFVEYKLNDKATLGFKATYFIKPTYYKLKADVKPSLTYMIGDKAKLIVFYKLDIQQVTKYVQPTTEAATGEVKDPKAIMTNTFQIDMIWSF